MASEIRTCDPLAYRSLPGTACWVQYYMALSFLASYEDGRSANPEPGDQADFRHAAYSGIAELFVTEDARMTAILTEMVPAVKSTIMSFQGFIDSI